MDPEEFVAEIEDVVVCHADQVPCWLRIGSQKQLYRKGEVRKRKRYQETIPHLSEPGAQAVRVAADDGMAQTRQIAKGDGGSFQGDA